MVQAFKELNTHYQVIHPIVRYILSCFVSGIATCARGRVETDSDIKPNTLFKSYAQHHLLQGHDLQHPKVVNHDAYCSHVAE